MRTLTLTDGTSYALDWCNADKGICYINLETDAPFSEIAMKFCNPEMTRKMRVKYDEEHEEIVTGYTKLQAIQMNAWSTGTVLITLLEDAA